MNARLWDLDRFVKAQDPVFEEVCAELKAGAKTSHWMWFVFPQLAALGRSSTAKFYGLTSSAEAAAYWAHPVLGTRLQRCSEIVLSAQGRSALAIFGFPDDLKLKSCMTLFETVASTESVFADVLNRFFVGHRDVNTLRLLESADRH